MAVLPRATAALLALGTAVTLAACSSGTGSAGGAGSAPIAVTATTPPASGQVSSIVWNLPFGEPTTLDPAKVGDFSPNTVEANLCDSLLRLRPDYSYGPGLAASWTEPDPLTLVLNLRPGVRFWDGDPLTPADVVYSLSREQDPATGAINGPAFASVRSIAATGPLQVTIRFSAPDEVFLKLLSTEVGSVSEAAYVKRSGKNYGSPGGGLMCTGPFRLASWNAGQDIVLTRNPAYWDPALEPKAGKVTFEFLTDANTISSALLSGQVDGTYELPVASVAAVAGSGAGHLYYGPSTQQWLLAPAGPSSPAADPRIDRALTLVMDNQAIVKSVFGGAAIPLRASIPPAVYAGSPQRAIYSQGYAALPPVPAQNFAAAKALVAKAGPKRTTLVLALAAGDQEGLQIATYLQAGARRIGLDVRIRQMQPTVFSSLFYTPSLRSGLDLVMTAGYVEVPDPLSYAPLIATPDGPFNWTGYSDPKVTVLLGQAVASTDPVTAARLFVRAQAIYTTGLPAITLASPYERLFLGKRISGAPASFAYINLPWAAMIGGTGK